MTYLELNANLKGRCKQQRKLGRSTWAIRREYPSVLDNYIAIRYHNTDIINFYPNGNVSMDIGRWFTVTTKQRLNHYLPHGYRVYSYKGEWFLYEPGMAMPLAVFTNGMTIHADGEISGAISFAEWDEERLHRIHINRSEAARKAAITRKQAVETWRLLGGDAYYA